MLCYQYQESVTVTTVIRIYQRTGLLQSYLFHLLPVLGSLFGLALAGVALGIWLAEIPETSRLIVPFSGGLLIGIAIFWVLPEIANDSGWLLALAGAAGGFALLWLIDRFLYPVRRDVHRFGPPLLAAAGVHSFFDGWSISVSQTQPSNGIKLAFLVGIGVHKLPEGLALGVLLLSATGSPWKAGLYSVVVQSAMFVGAFAALALASHLASSGTGALLAVASGVFIYLGYHAIEDQARERGLSTALLPALTGAAGAAVLKLVPGL